MLTAASPKVNPGLKGAAAGVGYQLTPANTLENPGISCLEGYTGNCPPACGNESIKWQFLGVRFKNCK